MFLIVSALKSELSYLVQNIPISEQIIMGQGSLYLGDQIHLLRTGIGSKKTSTTLLTYLKVYNPDYIINIGTAGALRSLFNIGDLVHVQAVKKERSDSIINLQDLPCLGMAPLGMVLTVSRPVLSKARKKKLFSIYQTDVVDMELFHLAKIARQYAIPLYSIKIVTDQADERTIYDFKANYQILCEKLGKYVFDLIHIQSKPPVQSV